MKINHGDKVSQKIEIILKSLSKDEKVELQASGKSCQKLLAVVEQCKHHQQQQQQKKKPLYQYNKLQGDTKNPELLIILSTSKLENLESEFEYTGQNNENS